ncbi:MAG: ABC transporter substrate-binding protein [Hyphomicrobiaceae bacterium]|nr:ABC transporter substrate-binding protein [Hyphomicrobiaceae bacterium]
MSGAIVPTTRRQWREIILIGGPAALLVVAAFWLAYQFVEPAPPSKLVITTGSEQGAYFAFAQRYREKLARNGIALEVLPSKGSVENTERLAATSKTNGTHVDLALLQGGIANSDTLPGMVSYGRVFLEPLWVFHRLEGDVDRLSQLAGKRIAIGAVGSGTRKLVETLLEANGIGAGTATLLPLGSASAIEALERGEADAAFFSLAPESPLIQKLMRDERFKLASLRQAEAYTRRFPFLSRIVLPEGAIDLVRNIPAHDVVMVAAQAGLVGRADLHPALAWPLVDALKTTHTEGGMFQRIGEFPKAFDPEFEMSEDALRIYQSGAPFFQRFLPFWLASFIERMIIMVVPIATILLPLVKLGPMLYEWRIKSRLLYWYAQLKELERQMAAVQQSGEAMASRPFRATIDRIDEAVSTIPVPLHYSDRLYELRGAIDLVRQRIETRG